MFLAAFLTIAALPLQEASQAKLEQCLQHATEDPAKAQFEAEKWRDEGGGVAAKRCLGTVYANQQRWKLAAETFEAAAREGGAGGGDLWALAGNAWLASGDVGRAGTAIDTAIGSGSLAGAAMGEAHLDRARVRVAAGDLTGARDDLDSAVEKVPDDALAWLLSATLARRMKDGPRAVTDIREALKRAPEDPATHLEAGNIAASAGDEAAARASWSRVIELAPGTGMAEAARKALEQFGTISR